MQWGPPGCAPYVRHAIVLDHIEDLGRPLHFLGGHAEVYLVGPFTRFAWRLDPERSGRTGATGDLEWPFLSIARALRRMIVFHGERMNGIKIYRAGVAAIRSRAPRRLKPCCARLSFHRSTAKNTRQYRACARP